MKKHQGRIHISRFHSTDEPHTGMHITVHDEASGCRLLEAYMTLEEFAKALTASDGKCELEFYADAPIGKKREIKEVVVPFTFEQHKLSRDKPSILSATLAPYEVDGWKGSVSDLQNHHRNAGENKQRVSFFRYV